MIPTPDWASATCAQVDPEIFHPENGGAQVQRRAKVVCSGCPIQQACLEYALATDEPNGVWGGLGRSERVALAVERGLPVEVGYFDLPDEFGALPRPIEAAA